MPWCKLELTCHDTQLIALHSVDHGAEATQYLAAFLGDHYMRSSEPVFKALWDSYNECQFVENEGLFFYKQTSVFYQSFFLRGYPVLQKQKGRSQEAQHLRDKKGVISTEIVLVCS